MRKILLVLPLLTCLSSCITAQEQERQISLANDSKCQAWGAKPGSEQYVKCRADLDRNAALQRQAIAQEEQAAYANQQRWYGSK